MNPNPSLRFGCLFMRTKSIKKQVFKKKEKSMDGGWGWGERAAPIPDPPIQAFFNWMEIGRKGRPDPRSPIQAFFTRFSPRE